MCKSIGPGTCGGAKASSATRSVRLGGGRASPRRRRGRRKRCDTRDRGGGRTWVGRPARGDPHFSGLRCRALLMTRARLAHAERSALRQFVNAVLAFSREPGPANLERYPPGEPVTRRVASPWADRTAGPPWRGRGLERGGLSKRTSCEIQHSRGERTMSKELEILYASEAFATGRRLVTNARPPSYAPARESSA